MDRKKTFKVMAYVLSTGIWDGFGCVRLDQVIDGTDPDLEAEMNAWQAQYDRQFMRYPYDFDWDGFNHRGEELTARIQDRLPPDTVIYYEPSDDREFFTSDEYKRAEERGEQAGLYELALRERKRSLLHVGL